MLEKKCFTIIVVFGILLLVQKPINAQNLIPNGSFECYDSCPGSGGKNLVNSATGWVNYTAIYNWALYYHPCSGTTYPFQPPFHQDAYILMNMSVYSFVNRMEIYGGYLKKPLEAGEVYKFSMWVSMLDIRKYTVNGIGAYFFDSLPSDINGFLYPNVSPQVLEMSNISDKNNWVEISNSFIATGNEKRFAIGRLMDEAYVTYGIKAPGTGFNAQYLIDKVCLTKRGTSCDSVPKFEISVDTTVCPGDSIELHAYWSDRAVWNYLDVNDSMHCDTVPSINANPDKTTTYYVTIKDCDKYITDSIKIEIGEHIDTTSFYNSITKCEDENEQLSVSDSNTVAINWTGGITGNSYIVNKGGYYVTELVYDPGCFLDTVLYYWDVLDTVCAYNIFIPNSFSPNMDGLNDVFFMRGYGFDDVILHIFDRWGIEVFSTINFTEGWDGNFNGGKASKGVYAYIFEGLYKDDPPVIQKGNITLMR